MGWGRLKTSDEIYTAIIMLGAPHGAAAMPASAS